EAAELNKCFLRDRASAISSACSRQPACPPKPRRRGVGDAGKIDFKPEANASQSEAATPACGIAVYTPVGTESAYTDILPAVFRFAAQRGETIGCVFFLRGGDFFKWGF